MRKSTPEAIPPDHPIPRDGIGRGPGGWHPSAGDTSSGRRGSTRTSSACQSTRTAATRRWPAIGRPSSTCPTTSEHTRRTNESQTRVTEEEGRRYSADRSIRWAFDLENIAARILDYRRLMGHWRAVLAVPVLEVAYEMAGRTRQISAKRQPHGRLKGCPDDDGRQQSRPPGKFFRFFLARFGPGSRSRGCRACVRPTRSALSSATPLFDTDLSYNTRIRGPLCVINVPRRSSVGYAPTGRPGDAGPARESHAQDHDPRGRPRRSR